MTHRQSAELQQKVADYISRHQELTYKQMSIELGISVPYISKIANKHGLHRLSRGVSFSMTDSLLQKLEQ